MLARIFLLPSIFLFLSVSLFAQSPGSTTGTLLGEVKDSEGRPLSGVTINVSGRTGTKTTLTDKNGVFVFPYLIPDAYSVKAELQNFVPIEQTNIEILLGQRTEVSFRLTTGVGQTIYVNGATAALIDTTDTSVGAHISEPLLISVPIGRSFGDAINMAPNVVDGRVGGANLSISGGSGLENSYIIDGVNITDPGFGALGSYATRFGALSPGFTVDMLKEVEIKTGGFEPEFGEALGGVINVITKSGGNRLSGELYAYFVPAVLEGGRNSVALKESFNINPGSVQSFDSGAILSGPLIKDKLFFFGVYNPSRTDTKFLNDQRALRYVDFPQATIVRYTQSYAAKVTLLPNANQEIEFSAFGDPSKSPLGFQKLDALTTPNPPNQEAKLQFGTNSQVLRWTGIMGANLFLEAEVARSHHHFEDVPPPAGNEWRVTDRTAQPAITRGGYGGYRQTDGNNLQYSLKLTNPWRSHEFRYGMELEQIGYDELFNLTGPTFTAFNGQQTTSGAIITVLPGGPQFGFDRVYLARGILSPLLSSTTTKYFDWYAQDSWRLTPFLNLQLGVRWEQQHIQGNRGTDVVFGNNWAPRLGATYDYLHNGRSKVYFHFGRFFERIPNLMAARTFNGSSNVFALYSDFFLTNYIPDSGSIVSGEPVEVEGLGNSSSPYRTRAQYSNEWIAGAEQEIASGFSIGAYLLHRDVRRVVENISINLDAPCITLPDGRCIPPGLRVEDLVDSPNNVSIIANVDGHYPGFPALVRNYSAFSLTAEKRFSNSWQLLASYTYAHLNGNYEGIFSRLGVVQPNFTSAADFANSPFTQFAYAKGPLPNDVRHNLKLFSSYRWNRLNAGFGVKFQTGRPIDELDQTGSRLIAPRGALGRTSNLFTLDLHGDYTIGIIGSHRLTIGIDVFNLSNSQSALDVSENFETNGPDFLKPTAFQDPSSIRFLLRYSF